MRGMGVGVHGSVLSGQGLSAGPYPPLTYVRVHGDHTMDYESSKIPRIQGACDQICYRLDHPCDRGRASISELGE